MSVLSLLPLVSGLGIELVQLLVYPTAAASEIVPWEDTKGVVMVPGTETMTVFALVHTKRPTWDCRRW